MINQAVSFADVLLRPRFSNHNSLSDANLSNEYDCEIPFSSLPIINSPMDSVCSEEMVEFLLANSTPVTIHRLFANPMDQIQFFEKTVDRSDDRRCFLAVGSVGKWKNWIDELLLYRKSFNREFGILVDMANGATKACVQTIVYINSKVNSEINIMAGNVADAASAELLATSGAQFIRVGLGGGCFTPDMMVLTVDGEKRIKDVNIGDVVYTHTGSKKEVLAKMIKTEREKIYEINDGQIKCTGNHEIYVVHKDDAEKVNEDNIQKYARWIRSDELSDDYLMIELDAEQDI